MLDANVKLQVDDESVELPFIRKTDADLIFHKDKFIDIKRLYISQSIVKDIFEIAYSNSYLDFERLFNIIFKF